MTAHTDRAETSKPILVTGATGYIGGRLVRNLEARRREVRCLARRPENLQDRVAPETRVFQGDAVTGEGLAEALVGVGTAYYLIHSMGSSGRFETEDRKAAENFAVAAREAGIERIIYLGGLGEELPHLPQAMR